MHFEGLNITAKPDIPWKSSAFAVPAKGSRVNTVGHNKQTPLWTVRTFVKCEMQQRRQKETRICQREKETLMIVECSFGSVKWHL